MKRSEPALRARGVQRAAVFGSAARGHNRPDRDIDVIVEIDPEAHLTVFDYVDLKDYVASLFDGPVDVVNRDSLKPHIRPGRPTPIMHSDPARTAATDHRRGKRPFGAFLCAVVWIASYADALSTWSTSMSANVGDMLFASIRI